VLDALVQADGAVEDDAFPGVAGGAVDRDPAQPDGLGPDQDALGVEAVEDDFEAFAFGSDAVFIRDPEVGDEQQVRVDRVPGNRAQCPSTASRMRCWSSVSSKSTWQVLPRRPRLLARRLLPPTRVRGRLPIRLEKCYHFDRR
jgi:hypothetical protein